MREWRVRVDPSRVTAQHDGAKAHTEGTVKGTIEDSSFTGDGKDDVRVDVVQQPSNSPDTNIWDIGAFNAHQKEFKRLEAFTNTKQRMMELVYKAWDKISWEVMDKSWACFFNNLRSIMQCRGDNNYKQAHNQCSGKIYFHGIYLNNTKYISRIYLCFSPLRDHTDIFLFENR